MAEHNPNPSESSLRQRALAKLANSPAYLSDLSHEEILQLVQELQVHQIELELQNEELKSITSELEQARSLFFTLFNHSPVGYILLDQYGVIQEVNQTFCTMVEGEPTQIIGKAIQNWIHPDDQSAFLSRYRALFHQPQDKTLELRLKREGKPPLWARVQGARLLLPSFPENAEKTDRLLLAFNDITAQKIAEEERRLDERRLQSLVEIAEYPYTSVEELLRFTLEKAVAVTNSEFGYLLDVIEETEQMRIHLVSERAQQLSKLDSKAYTQSYLLSESGLRAEAVRQRQPVIINDYRQPHPQKRGYPEGHVEIRRFLSVPVFEDGRIVAVISVANKAEPYTQNDARQLSLMMDSAWKMIVRQRLAEALQESEQNLRSFFDTVDDIFVVATPDGKLQYGNAALTRKLGYTLEELVGLHLLDLHPPHLRQEAQVILEEMVQGKRDTCPLPLITKGGDLFPVETRIWFGRWNSQDCIFGISKDLTAVVEAQQRFERIFHNNPNPMALSSPDRRFIAVNEAFLNLLGYTPEEVLGKTARELNLFPNQEQQDAVAALLARQGYIRNFELQVRRKDGRILDGLFSGELIESQGKKVFLTVMVDLTERKEAELALQRLLQEYETLFNGVQDAVFLVEVEEDGQFRYLRTNITHQQKTGISLEMIQGKTPEELLGEELGARLRQNYQRCVDAGQPITYEETLDLPGGRRTWSTTLTPVVQDSRIRYIVGAATDITEQKIAQEAIRQSEARYRTLFENMTEGFALHEMLWDENGRPLDYRFLEVNPAFERLTGLPAEQAVGKTVRQLLPDLETSWIERYAEVARTGQPIVFEEYGAALKRWYEVRAFSPQAGYFATVFTDITQRKQWDAERERLIQDLQRKNSELSQFTYTVSHDLKSPLITILGFLSFVEQSLEQGNREQAQADLQRIRFAAEKMQALLEGLLELSRIGRLVNPPSEFSFGEIVMEAVQLLLGNIRHQGRTVEFDIAPDLPVVYGDRARLLQVMQNLLDNALKYMGEQPQPRIEIGWRAVDNELQFYVRDNGIGIDPALQEKVFGLFEKLDPRAEGYGVGLALVKRIIEVHHGRIWVESEGEGKGCTFWFTLPKAPKSS